MEQLYFGQLTGTDPNADPDGDGFSNLKEYIADTNPTNLNSSLRLLSTQVVSNRVSLTWSGGAQARQHLQRALNWGGALLWTNLQTNEPPTPLTNSYLDLPGTNQAGFYRLEAEWP